jgi:ankyrin repeat protein
MTYPELLLWASRMGEVADVQECMAEKVDVNTRDKTNQNTALHLACANKFLLIAKILIENGADLNAQNDSGNTPLHWAVISQDMEIVKFLIEKKANANLKNSAGLMPFEEALNSGNRPMSEILAKVSKLEDDEIYTVVKEVGEGEEEDKEEKEAAKMFPDDVKEEHRGEEVKREDGA